MSATMPTTKPPNKQAPDPTPTHEIKISLKDDYDSRMPHWEVGETVRYLSNSGEVTVEFPERSPFRTDGVTGTEVPGAVILTLVNDSGGSTLPCHYYLKPPGGGPRERIIWGGEGTDVGRPNNK